MRHCSGVLAAEDSFFLFERGKRGVNFNSFPTNGVAAPLFFCGVNKFSLSNIISFSPPSFSSSSRQHLLIPSFLHKKRNEGRSQDQSQYFHKNKNKNMNKKKKSRALQCFFFFWIRLLTLPSAFAWRFLGIEDVRDDTRQVEREVLVVSVHRGLGPAGSRPLSGCPSTK